MSSVIRKRMVDFDRIEAHKIRVMQFQYRAPIDWRLLTRNRVKCCGKVISTYKVV